MSQLSLHYNNFNGSIPMGLGNISYLVQLEINHNNFTGTLPSDLQHCTDLEIVRMDQNKLTGMCLGLFMCVRMYVYSEVYLLLAPFFYAILHH